MNLGNDRNKRIEFLASILQSKTTSGASFILYGPPNSSKHTLIESLSDTMGDRFPFVVTSAAEFSPSKFSNGLRRAVGVRLREIKEIYEGEVISLVPHPANETTALPEGKGFLDPKNVLLSFSLTLRSSNGTKKLNLDAYSYTHFLEQSIRPGDVVLIEAASGLVRRLGRCDLHATEFDLESEKYVPQPKGDVHRRKIGVKDTNLGEIDAANLESSSEFETINVIQRALNKTSSKERMKSGGLSEEVKEEVNKTIAEYEQKGNAQISPGVLVVDDAHLLTEENAATALNSSENEGWQPTVLFVCSRNIEMLPIALKNKAFFLNIEEVNDKELTEICLESLKKQEINETTFNLFESKLKTLTTRGGGNKWVEMMLWLQKEGLNSPEKVLSWKEAVLTLLNK